MTKNKVTVVAFVKAKRGAESSVKQILTGLLAPTRAENGCINYDLHQSSEDPSEFLFYENWESKEVLDLHLKTPHIAQAMASSASLLVEPVKITLWEHL